MKFKISFTTIVVIGSHFGLVAAKTTTVTSTGKTTKVISASTSSSTSTSSNFDEAALIACLSEPSCRSGVCTMFPNICGGAESVSMCQSDLSYAPYYFRCLCPEPLIPGAALGTCVENRVPPPGGGGGAAGGGDCDDCDPLSVCTRQGHRNARCQCYTGEIIPPNSSCNERLDLNEDGDNDKCTPNRCDERATECFVNEMDMPRCRCPPITADDGTGTMTTTIPIVAPTQPCPEGTEVTLGPPVNVDSGENSELVTEEGQQEGTGDGTDEANPCDDCDPLSVCTRQGFRNAICTCYTGQQITTSGYCDETIDMNVDGDDDKCTPNHCDHSATGCIVTDAGVPRCTCPPDDGTDEPVLVAPTQPCPGVDVAATTQDGDGEGDRDGGAAEEAAAEEEDDYDPCDECDPKSVCTRQGFRNAICTCYTGQQITTGGYCDEAFDLNEDGDDDICTPDNGHCDDRATCVVGDVTGIPRCECPEGDDGFYPIIKPTESCTAANNTDDENGQNRRQRQLQQQQLRGSAVHFVET